MEQAKLCVSTGAEAEVCGDILGWEEDEKPDEFNQCQYEQMRESDKLQTKHTLL